MMSHYQGWFYRIYSPFVEYFMLRRPHTDITTLRRMRDQAVTKLNEDRVMWDDVVQLKQADIDRMSEELLMRWQEERDLVEKNLVNNNEENSEPDEESFKNMTSESERETEEENSESDEESSENMTSESERETEEENSESDEESSENMTSESESDEESSENMTSESERETEEENSESDEESSENMTSESERETEEENSESDEESFENMTYNSERETEDEVDFPANSEQECSVCKTNRCNTTLKPCKHDAFCARCVGRLMWKKRKVICPLCRVEITCIEKKKQRRSKYYCSLS